MMDAENNPDMMVADQRLDEIAAILTLVFRRIRNFHDSEKSSVQKVRNNIHR